MRFKTKTRPRGLLRPGDQKRLSLLIVGFGVIMVCFSIVRRPNFWKGMFPDPAVGVAETTEPSQETLTEDVSAASRIGDDEFFIGTPSDTDETISVTTKRVSYDETQTDVELTQVNKFPRLSADLLRTVKDDVIGVHSTESDAYFAALKMALRAEEKTLEPTGKGAYALFMDSPNGSRGKAYEIEGKLRLISVVRGQSNSMGVGAVYDAWVSTPDSGNQLVHVVALKSEPPIAGLIRKNNPTQSIKFDETNSPSIKFTGYFFKIEGYALGNRSGISRAPLLLAGTLRDIPPPAAVTNRADELTPYLGYLAIVICASVMFMVWTFAMSDIAHTQTRTHQLTKLPAVASFEDVTSVSVMESLNELEFSHSRSNSSKNHID